MRVASGAHTMLSISNDQRTARAMQGAEWACCTTRFAARNCKAEIAERFRQVIAFGRDYHRAVCPAISTPAVMDASVGRGYPNDSKSSNGGSSCDRRPSSARSEC